MLGSQRVHPGKYPIGSAESRAAARALVTERRSNADVREWVYYTDEASEPDFGPWEQTNDQAHTRHIRIPVKTTLEDAERSAGQAPTVTSGKHLRFVVHPDGAWELYHS